MPSSCIQDTSTDINTRFSSGFIAIVGRPSVGKSTFINAVCGKNTAITSVYPQTTRSIIRGIVTRDTFQIIFLDTPGLHTSSTTLGLHLHQRAVEALKECEGILYMVDITRAPKGEEENIAKLISHFLSTHKRSLFIACNKCDVQNTYGKISEEYASHFACNFPSTALHFISAETGEGIPLLLQAIAASLPQHAPFYPNEYYTDQSAEFRICEQVRGAAIEKLTEELPHALYTRILESSVKHRNVHDEVEHVFVRVELVVETESQRGILIGKGGKMIKAIRIEATKRIAKLFFYKVQLQLRVGVQKKWRKNRQTFAEILC